MRRLVEPSTFFPRALLILECVYLALIIGLLAYVLLGPWIGAYIGLFDYIEPFFWLSRLARFALALSILGVLVGVLSAVSGDKHVRVLKWTSLATMTTALANILLFEWITASFG